MRLGLSGMLAALAAMTQAGTAFAQGVWPEECKLTRMAELPISFKSGHAIIPAQIGGKTVAMELDTGSPVTGLTKDTIADLGLVTHLQNSRLILDIAGVVADEYVRVSDFKLDHMERGGVYFSVLQPMRDAGGALGADVLRNYDVELDTAHGRLTLFRPHPCDDRAVYWTGTYTVIPISTVTGNGNRNGFGTVIPGRVVKGGLNKEGVLNAGHIRVPVTLDGQQVDAVIDTGAPLSLISMSEAKRLFGIDAANTDVKAAGRLVGGAGGELQAYSYPFKTLTMGGVSVTNPKIRIGEGQNFLQADYASLLLGMDLLQQLHLYIAYNEGKLYVSSADAGH